MSFDDYIKFITQSFVKHLETPKSERVQLRRKRKEEKPPFVYQWFGLLPFAITMLFKRKS